MSELREGRYRAHVSFFDHDGFAADVEDVPSSWHPTFPVGWGFGVVMACIPSYVPIGQYERAYKGGWAP